MRAYNVTLAGKVIDTVYFPDGTPESEIRHSLINTVSAARSKYLDPGIIIEAQLSRSEIVSAIEGAIATRGKNKGQLKQSALPRIRTRRRPGKRYRWKRTRTKYQ